MQALRDLAAGDDIDIHGLVEKKDLVEKIQCELAKNVVDYDKAMVNKHLAEAGAAGGTSLAVGSSDDGGTSLAVGSSVDSSASNLAICPPPGVAGKDVVDYDKTEEVFPDVAWRL